MKTHHSNLYFIIPIYNEALNIETLFASIEKITDEFKAEFNPFVVIVDDGSSDNTIEQIEKQVTKSTINCKVIKHKKNLGPGAAFQTAFADIKNQLYDNDWVVTLEGDNTSRIELLMQMFYRADEGYDVVFASPYCYGGGIINTSSFRVILSNIANTFVKEFLEVQGIHTVSSFFRLYRGTALIKLQKIYGDKILETNGFECMLEMLMKMINLKISISEVPMVLDTKRRYGKSKMKILKTIIAYLSLWFYKKKWKKIAIN